MKKYIILIIIFILIFLIFYYKNQKLGNTIIKLSDEKIIENILNGKLDYTANVKVTVYSNKNENEYQLKIEEKGQNTIIEGLKGKDISRFKNRKNRGRFNCKKYEIEIRQDL